MSDLFNYVKTRETATRLITKFGKSIKIRRLDRVGQFEKPWAEELQQATDTDTKAVFLDFDEKRIDGTQVLENDVMALVAALDAVIALEPNDTDKVVSGSDVYTIVKCQPLKPANDLVMYQMQLRLG